MLRKLAAIILLLSVMSTCPASGQNDDGSEVEINSGLVSGLSFRSIGPALASGRIGDIAIDPVDRSTWYIAVASGNVWKTTNSGNTWNPIFDSYGSYSIGCVAVDPNNRHVVWVGTGENNSQRSVSYGDGAYKSLDGGRSFENVGLENSEHIGRILIDPRNSDVVYVAAQGPLWSAGGDRGLFKTTDGGKTWTRVLEIDQYTGVTDVHFDPRNPDVLYAAAYQRMRRVWTLINGGPGSGIHKSTDGGATWKEINKGLPGGDLGRIGLAVSPQNPDVIYAIVEATDDKSGFFRSTDRGENWSKMSDYVSGSPQYYQEIFAEPNQFDKLYSMDVLMRVTIDGGKTWERVGRDWKHVDDHALAFDPNDPKHLIAGCDGGLYETWDSGENWHYKPNLPVTQFYKIALDNAEPFYNVYGGTQDNWTQGGPSRTRTVHGIRNSDWFVTVGGDGFEPAVDPENPNIVYSQWQYGGLIRFNKITGQRVDIKPREKAEGPPLRWNWDSALMISPHSNTRLYYGAQILFRSDDRGNSWREVSPDLTRNVDRNKLEIMGRVWSVDAVAKNWNTSLYGTIVALSESPLKEGLLYVGTDDGLVQVTSDGGENWTRIERFADVPQYPYVSDIEASLYDTNIVYAALDNHKMGDFKPYVVRSTDKGRSWKLISGNLPERGTVYALMQDHVDRNLLFAGTEFGVYFTVDGGENWVELSAGIPTIMARDIEIQRRENDLAVATFGRGFYILDDYTPLRHLTQQNLTKGAHIFPIKKAWMYIQTNPMGGGEKSSQGAGFYTAPNPPFGATFTYHLKESLKTRREERHEREKELAKEGEDVFYPTWEELKVEDREFDPTIILTVRDSEGEVVRHIDGSTSSGIHRATWDFRYPSLRPVTSGGSNDGGPMALPGTYTLTIEKLHNGELTMLAGPMEFEVEPLGYDKLTPSERSAMLAFQHKTARLQRAVLGTYRVLEEASEQIDHIQAAIDDTPELGYDIWSEARDIELRLMDIREEMVGDRTKQRRAAPYMPGILNRVNQIVYGHWSTTQGPTETHRKLYDIASSEFTGVLDRLRGIVEVEIAGLHERLEAAGAPWTPGRGLPDWQPE